MVKMHEINTAATSSSPCAPQGNNGQFRNRIKQSPKLHSFSTHTFDFCFVLLELYKAL